MDDLAVILVSHHGERWLRRCLESVFAHSGECRMSVVVVNNADDGTEAIVKDEFPSVTLLRCENHGFAHANNRGVTRRDARYYLFLNVDTEVLTGSFEELVAALDERPSVGMAGVRQVTPQGKVAPTIRYFPTALRSLGEALWLERLPNRAPWLGEREMNPERYDEEWRCDWTSGSFLVVRREVLLGAGLMDERFFLYSEEPDLCLRGKQAGWEMRHLPLMTIRHHGGSPRSDARLAAQDAFARMQFARKHFSQAHRASYALALAFGYAIRAAAPARTRAQADRRHAARSALRMLVGSTSPPFGPPPEHAIIPPGTNGRWSG